MSKALKYDVVLHGDSVAEMDKLPSRSVDVIFADPPYNLQLSGELHRPDLSRVDGVDAEWDSFADFAAYDAFTTRWLEAARRVLKDTGTLWVIGSYHNIFRVGAAVQNIGFWILNDIIWRKTNPMPNFHGTRFTNAHETLIWAVRDEHQKNYKFNYHAMKTFNDDVQMRSDWLIPLCKGGERLKDGAGRKLHPTQKPEALLHRIILASSDVGDVILDPFFGSGTSGAVAKYLGRHYIGIDSNADYVEAARARLRAIEPLDNSAQSTMTSPKPAMRVPFGNLIEHGFVKPGTVLFDRARNYQARVRADGSLSLSPSLSKEAKQHMSQMTGSIHKMGAQAQGVSNCNGWTFWHIKSGKTLIPIDALRQQFIDKKT